MQKKQAGFCGAAAKEHIFYTDANVLKMADSSDYSANSLVNWYSLANIDRGHTTQISPCHLYG